MGEEPAFPAQCFHSNQQRARRQLLDSRRPLLQAASWDPNYQLLGAEDGCPLSTPGTRSVILAEARQWG